MIKRRVIVHFHLFKNAGTSVDRILRNNFSADEWMEIEGPNNKKLDTEALLDFIRHNPGLKAVSSHTAVVSVPKLDDIEIIPILFLRHPIDRIRSAYDFERNQDANTPGAIKAKDGDFKSYMDWRLSTPAPWQVSNFHAMRLKDFFEFTPAKQQSLFLACSKQAIDVLPTVGFVETFDASIKRIAELIRPHFPDFSVKSVHENFTSARDKGLDSKLEAFEQRIGSDTYRKLEAINEIDFQLYQYAMEKVGSH